MTTCEKYIKRNLERMGCNYKVLTGACTCFCVDCDIYDESGCWTGIDWDKYYSLMNWLKSRKTIHVEVKLVSDVCHVYIYDRMERVKSEICSLLILSESDMFFLSSSNKNAVKQSILERFDKADRALDYLRVCGTEDDVSLYGSKVQQIAEMANSIA